MHLLRIIKFFCICICFCVFVFYLHCGPAGQKTFRTSTSPGWRWTRCSARLGTVWTTACTSTWPWWCWPCCWASCRPPSSSSSPDAPAPCCTTSPCTPCCRPRSPSSASTPLVRRVEGRGGGELGGEVEEVDRCVLMGGWVRLRVGQIAGGSDCGWVRLRVGQIAGGSDCGWVRLWVDRWLGFWVCLLVD